MTAIRLIGEHHTSDREGTVLTVADERTALTNPSTVSLSQARRLVGCGRAEWVGAPSVITLADESQIDHPGGR